MQTLKANRLPQAIEITIMTLDRRTILHTAEVPEQVNELDQNGALDVEASRRSYEEILKAQNIYTARVFTTRARLINGS